VFSVERRSVAGRFNGRQRLGKALYRNLRGVAAFAKPFLTKHEALGEPSTPSCAKLPKTAQAAFVTCCGRNSDPKEKVVFSMTKSVSAILVAGIAALGLRAAPAHAAPVTITFETAPLEFFTAPVVESGFTYAPVSGSLYVSPNGRPGQDMEGDGSGGGGVLGLTSSVAGGTFQFVGLDFSAYNIVAGTPGTITVAGLLRGVTVGSDSYTLAAVDAFPYTNWTSEQAVNLAGQVVDALLISLPGSATDDAFYDNVDNIQLDATSVPEPTSLALLGAGLFGLTILRRHRA